MASSTVNAASRSLSSEMWVWQVATTGDFVLTAEEVNPVSSALEEHNIQVTALHSHMLTEQPRLFFKHFWAAGKTESIAQGIKAALSHIATK
jgi:hypothetical protein